MKNIAYIFSNERKIFIMGEVESHQAILLRMMILKDLILYVIKIKI